MADDPECRQCRNGEWSAKMRAIDQKVTVVISEPSEICG
jgi:hypothetical protein